MVIAGEHLTEATVRELTDFLGTDPLAQKFRGAIEHGNTIVSLTPEERLALLRKLDDAPPRLTPLRQRLRDQTAKRPGDGMEERRRALERQASRANCLVHFPDGTTSEEQVLHRKLQVGLEILDGWIVSQLPQMNVREVNGNRLSYDVWVDRKGSHELDDKLARSKLSVRAVI